MTIRPSNDLREQTGPFDIIGDLHGCADELKELLDRLGYSRGEHSGGRRLIFLGDLTDRGPANWECLEIVMGAVVGGALCVCGNHDEKLRRHLEGRQVQIARGLEKTALELSERSPKELQEVKDFLNALPGHYRLDKGRLVVAHAGLKEELHGTESGKARSFCLYGDTTGRVDEDGFPERLNWAAHYSGQALVVYGHTPVRSPLWLNHTVNIDTGCVFGGSLTALRYPELELVSVAAREVYYYRAGVSPDPQS